MNLDLLKIEGYDDCIEGICHKYGQEPFIVYNFDKVITKLIKDGMTYHEAVEFHEFNQACVYMGDQTPAFLYRDEI